MRGAWASAMKATTLIALMVPVVALWISAVVAFARSLEA